MNRRGKIRADVAERRLTRAQFLVQANHALTAFAWAAALTLFGFFLLVAAPRVQRHHEQAVSEEIERENTAFCTKHGLVPRTPVFRSCVLDLMEIRANQDRRRADDAGIL